MDHGSCFAQTVLRNATQVKRLRQDKLGKNSHKMHKNTKL